VFGPQTFWVTEMRLVEEKDKMGILVRGNLRDDRDKLFKWVDLQGGKGARLHLNQPACCGKGICRLLVHEWDAAQWARSNALL
jgi:hypothetical protein